MNTKLENPFGDVLPEHQRLGVVRASEIQPEAIEWLWPDRVARAMVNVLAGPPGVGKSTILYDLDARISQQGRTVLIITAEDHLAAVVRPRLEAAGADLNLVVIVTAPFVLPDDVARLEALVREHDAAMVTLDPLVAFLGDGVNTHRDHHVRRVLAPLGDLAERTRAAVVPVIHTNKGMSSDPLMRISGSIGFTAAARSIIAAAEDPNDDNRRILAVVKSNLAKFPPPLAYRLTQENLGNGIETSRVEWLGEAPEVDVRSLFGVNDPEERTAFADALEFLREAGVLEDALPAATLLSEGKRLGLSEPTLRRARHSLGVRSWKDGSAWIWGPHSKHPRWQGVGEDVTPTPVILTSSPLPAETDPLEAKASRRIRVGEPEEVGAQRDELEPGWRDIQIEAGEEPPANDEEALANIRAAFPSTRVVEEATR
jgi:hypothetical protein